MFDFVQSSNQISESIWWWYYANSPLKIAQFDVSDCWRLYHLPLYGVSSTEHVSACEGCMVSSPHDMGWVTGAHLHCTVWHSTAQYTYIRSHYTWSSSQWTQNQCQGYWRQHQQHRPLRHHDGQGADTFIIIEIEIYCVSRRFHLIQKTVLFYLSLLISMELIWESKTN